MRNLVLALVILAVPFVAAAQKIGPRHAAIMAKGSTGLLIDGLDLQSSRAFTLTDEVEGIRGMGVLLLLVNLSQQNTVTRVDMSCSISDDGNTTDYVLQSCSTSSGTCTSNDAAWQKTVAAADQWEWRVDVLGLAAGLDMECTFSVGAGSGTSTDVISVNGYFVTQ